MDDPIEKGDLLPSENGMDDPIETGEMLPWETGLPDNGETGGIVLTGLPDIGVGPPVPVLCIHIYIENKSSKHILIYLEINFIVIHIYLLIIFLYIYLSYVLLSL